MLRLSGSSDEVVGEVQPFTPVEPPPPDAALYRSDGTLNMNGALLALFKLDGLTTDFTAGNPSLTYDDILEAAPAADATVRAFSKSHTPVFKLWIKGYFRPEVRVHVLDMITTMARVDSGRVKGHEADMAIAECNHRVMQSCVEK